MLVVLLMFTLEYREIIIMIVRAEYDLRIHRHGLSAGTSIASNVLADTDVSSGSSPCS
jgi:hypothetical protein